MQRVEHRLISESKSHVSLRDIDINPDRPVLDFAVRNVEYVSEHDTIYKVVEKAMKTGFRRFPVISMKGFPKKRETLVGIVTVMDILDAFLRDEDFNQKITEIMTRDVVFCYSDESIGTTLKKFKFSRRGGFPIIDKRKTLIGLITEHDIIKLFLGHRFDVKVEHAMTHKPFFLTPKRFYDALDILVNTRYRKLPVLDNNKLSGLVTDRLCLDVIRANNFQKNNLLFNIKDVMIKNIYTISPEADISKAIELLIQYRLGGLLITTNSTLKGILTERDILSKIRV